MNAGQLNPGLISDPGSGGGPIARPGVFPTPRLTLTSPDFGITLNIKVSVPPLSDNEAKTARIFYLSPLDVGDQSIILDINTAKISAQFVIDVPIDRRVITQVPYTPLGSQGTRRDYSLGGWMYAMALPASDLDIGTDSSNLVAVPVFDQNTSPADTQMTPGAPLLVTGPVAGVYTVTVNVVNPSPIFGRTRYCHIWMYNYFNDATFRSCGTFRLHGAPGDPNGQIVTYKLEADGGGHAVVFYMVPLNGQRSMPFGVPISSYFSVAVPGGFP